LLRQSGDPSRDADHVLSAAAYVLAGWPHNFYQLLNSLQAESSPERFVRITRGPFRGIYQSLLGSTRVIEPKVDGEFLRIAFQEFFAEHRARGLVDENLMRGLHTENFSRYISRSEFARRFGITNETAIRLLKERKIACRAVRVGAYDRIVIDGEKVDLPRTLRLGKTYSQNEAARMIGVSVLVLKDLRISGHFEVVHKLGWKRGYHELDIQAFTEKFMGLVSKEGNVISAATESIPIANIMAATFGTVHVKANVIRAMLSRDLRVLGKIDNTLGGLLVPYEQCRNFLRNERARVYGGRTPAEAAESLQCHSESIPGLLKRGLLTGSRASKGLRITDESIADFRRKYLCIALLAKGMVTSASALMAWCNEVNVPMITVFNSSGSQQGFIRVEDRARVLKYQPKRFRSRPDTSNYAAGDATHPISRSA
jgi:hypothetical protein